MGWEHIERVFKNSKPETTGSELLVLVTLAKFISVSDVDSCYPSVSTVAALCHMTTRNFQYTTKHLVDSGELEILQGAGPKGCNVYRVKCLSGVQHSSSLFEVKISSGVKDASGMKSSVVGGEEQRQKGVKPSSSKSNRNLKESKKEEPADVRRQPFIEFFLDEYVRSRGVRLVTHVSDFSALKAMLAATREDPAYCLESLCKSARQFLNSTDEFDRKQGHPLRFFCSNINRFTLGRNKAVPSHEGQQTQDRLQALLSASPEEVHA